MSFLSLFQNKLLVLFPAVIFGFLNTMLINPFATTVMKFLLSTDPSVHPEQIFHMHYALNFSFSVTHLCIVRKFFFHN